MNDSILEIWATLLRRLSSRERQEFGLRATRWLGDHVGGGRDPFVMALTAQAEHEIREQYATETSNG